ncbi:MAG: hypothetical protein HY040_27250 [Planctomycetes bacterium]|nr:hypothetical protein [Planctomycetota bacterium]
MSPPTVFSVASLLFERDPEDVDLGSLLGEVDHPGNIVVVETPDILLARPGLIPMKFVLPWMLVIGAVITLMPWIAPQFGGRFEGPIAWLMLAVMWGLVIPAFLGILLLGNRHFAKKGDYFRADKLDPHLEIPRLGRTFGADQILAITELSRWFKHLGAWEWTRQIGILVRGSDCQVEQHPLVRVNEVEWWRRRLSDRIADIFQVPVRRIELKWGASRRLKDC